MKKWNEPQLEELNINETAHHGGCGWHPPYGPYWPWGPRPECPDRPEEGQS